MRRFLLSLFISGSLILNVTASVNAQQENIDEVINDVSVTKQVSINGGEYFDADDITSAPSGFVDDTVTWKITVQYSGNNEVLNVDVHDAIPNGFEIINTSDSSNYNAETGVWNADGITNEIPLSLEIVTKAKEAGDFTNTATLGYWIYDETQKPYFIDGYEDTVGGNNSDVAHVSIKEKNVITAVLGSSTTISQAGATLSKTGNLGVLVVLFSIAVVSVVGGLSVFSKKQ